MQDYSLLVAIFTGPCFLSLLRQMKKSQSTLLTSFMLSVGGVTNIFNIPHKSLVSQCVSHCHNNPKINFIAIQKAPGSCIVFSKNHSYKAAHPCQLVIASAAGTG